MSQKLEQLFSFNNQISKIIEEKFKQEIRDDDRFSLFLSFVLSKAFKTHEAIMLLCRNGYGEDAFMLARTLFELAIMTSYILQDQKEYRLSRYIEYDWVTRKEMYDYASSDEKTLEKLNQEISLGNYRPEVIEQIKKEYERVMEKYKYNYIGWSDKSIAEMSKSIGRLGAYKTVYRLQCIIGHTNARSINEYIKEVDGETIINIGQNDDLVEKTLVMIFDFFRMIIEEANKQFKWNLEDALESIYKEYVQEVGKLNI